MEKQNTKHTVYYNRTDNNNDAFAKINTGEKRTKAQIINSLTHPEKRKVRDFFQDVQLHFDCDEFEDDFTTIALSAPELKEDFIRKDFLHVVSRVSHRKIL